MCKVSLLTAKDSSNRYPSDRKGDFSAGHCDDKAWLSVDKVKYGVLFKLK